MIPQKIIDLFNNLNPEHKALLIGLYVYDVESYPNVFTITIFRPEDFSLWRFEISQRRNDAVTLYQFIMQLKGCGGRMVGFNNLHYDYPVIHSLLMRGGHITAFEMWQTGNAIIHSDDPPRIWPSDIVVPQIDLLKIHHMDNNARRTSLKMIEFNMMSEDIRDLPFKPNTELTDEQIDVLIPYNDHDVFETAKFLIHTLDMLKFRDELSIKYGRDFTNFNDGKIGSTIFIIGLEEAGVPCYERVEGRKQPRQTIRHQINLNEAVLPWINFQTVHFQRVTDWFRSQVITKTKGVFEFIEVNQEMALETMSPDFIRVHGFTVEDFPEAKKTKTFENKLNGKGFPLKEVREHLRPGLKYVSGWKDQSGLNCIVNGFQFDFGTGGIHGSIESQIVYSDNTHVIIDLDVASYYPNLGIVNRFYPAHLSEVFDDIYEGIFEQRRQFKKGTMENLALKYALNVPYGQSNSAFSPFYDSLYTMKITINGQLLLCLLAEYAMTIDGLNLIQVNTDGITVRLPRSKLSELKFISDTWQQVTGLVLEEVEYSRMMIRDVNNYIAEGVDGKLKRKGAYCYGKDLDWHQNFSSQVVAKAAEAALVHNADIGEFIRNNTNPLDFMLRTKVDRSSRLVIGPHDEQLQNITRYYVSTGGAPLTKIMPPTPDQVKKAEFPLFRIMRKGGKPDVYATTLKQFEKNLKDGFEWNGDVGNQKAPNRRFSINSGWNVTPCNHLSEFGRSPINYEFYIHEAEKLVKPIRP